MSGSGPTLFGLFPRRRDAEAAARRFAGRRGWMVCVVKPLSAPALRAGRLLSS